MSRNLYMSILLTFVWSFPLIACADGREVQNLIVTDYGHYYNGIRSESLDAFRLDVESNIDAVFVVTACQCADADLAVAALELLKTLGAQDIAIESAHQSAKYCGDCE